MIHVILLEKIETPLIKQSHVIVQDGTVTVEGFLAHYGDIVYQLTAHSIGVRRTVLLDLLWSKYALDSRSITDDVLDRRLLWYS